MNMFKESQKNMKTEKNYNKELNMTYRTEKYIFLN